MNSKKLGQANRNILNHNSCQKGLVGDSYFVCRSLLIQSATSDGSDMVDRTELQATYHQDKTLWPSLQLITFVW